MRVLLSSSLFVLSRGFGQAPHELTCPTPSTSHIQGCMETSMAPFTCCMWNQQEDLFGATYISDMLTAFGDEAAEYATLAPLVKCSSMAPNPAQDCTKKVSETSVGQMLPTDGDASLLSQSYVAMVCAATCKDSAGAVALMTGSCAGVEAPTPGSADSVYDCPTTSAADAEETEAPETSSTATTERTAVDASSYSARFAVNSAVTAVVMVLIACRF